MGNNGNVGLGNYGGAHTVMWTDLADVDPIHFFVQDGVAYVGRRNGLPVPAVDGDPDAHVWGLGVETPTVEAVVRFGIGDAEMFVRGAESSGQCRFA